MRRMCVLVLVAGAATLVSIGVAGTVWFRDGVSARPEPSHLESFVARRVRHWAVPREARSRLNPEPATPVELKEAREHFADHCAQCHGNDGSGDTTLGRGLYPRAPDMRLEATQAMSDGELFWIIENGVRLTGMPAWGGSGDERPSWRLVHFIRHLPKLTPEEKRQMEELNPRSPDEWRELEEEKAFLEGGSERQRPGAGEGAPRSGGEHHH